MELCYGSEPREQEAPRLEIIGKKFYSKKKVPQPRPGPPPSYLPAGSVSACQYRSRKLMPGASRRVYFMELFSFDSCHGVLGPCLRPIGVLQPVKLWSRIHAAPLSPLRLLPVRMLLMLLPICIASLLVSAPNDARLQDAGLLCANSRRETPHRAAPRVPATEEGWFG